MSALRLLRCTVVENPTAISEPIKEKMPRSNRSTVEESATSVGASSSHMSSPDPLFWFEHSRLTLHSPNVNWGWVVATILKCFFEQKCEEAESRCLLALAAVDQIDLDQC
jgi:hypothetical protein